MSESKLAGDVAKVLKSVAAHLKNNPMEIYVLKDAEEELNKIINSKKYKDIPDGKFLKFFYENFRYHLWHHVAAYASLKVKDSQTMQIMRKVADGLQKLANSLETNDKAGIYDSLKYLIFNYLVELDKEVET